jgi:hypothetical protein
VVILGGNEDRDGRPGGLTDDRIVQAWTSFEALPYQIGLERAVIELEKNRLMKQNNSPNNLNPPLGLNLLRNITFPTTRL